MRLIENIGATVIGKEDGLTVWQVPVDLYQDEEFRMRMFQWAMGGGHARRFRSPKIEPTAETGSGALAVSFNNGNWITVRPGDVFSNLNVNTVAFKILYR